MIQVTNHDKESWLAAIWEALDDIDLPDDQRDNICTAMAWIREDLGLPDQMESR